MSSGLYVKYLLFLSDLNETRFFFGRLRENTQISAFMEIRLVGTELFHADRRTDKHDEANSRFSQFYELV
jgi:hypothetical protein